MTKIDKKGAKHEIKTIKPTDTAATLCTERSKANRGGGKCVKTYEL